MIFNKFLLFCRNLFCFIGGIMITKEKLKVYANKLMFDMEDSEYETLLK